MNVYVLIGLAIHLIGLVVMIVWLGADLIDDYKASPFWTIIWLVLWPISLLIRLVFSTMSKFQ
jgi:hypothetical protein